MHHKSFVMSVTRTELLWIVDCGGLCKSMKDDILSHLSDPSLHIAVELLRPAGSSWVQHVQASLVVAGRLEVLTGPQGRGPGIAGCKRIYVWTFHLKNIFSV